jgi:hypothetical protein
MKILIFIATSETHVYNKDLVGTIVNGNTLIKARKVLLDFELIELKKNNFDSRKKIEYKLTIKGCKICHLLSDVNDTLKITI